VVFLLRVKKVDLVGRHRGEYAAARTPRIVTAGRGRYLALTGSGDPGDALFRAQLGLLQELAASLKASKKVRGKDFRVPPLEALWWELEPGSPAVAEPGSRPRWKLLLRVPNFVKPRDLASAAEALRSRGPGTAAGEVHLEELREGRCIQALHLGPPGTEAETIERMRRAAAAQGLAFHGRHHVIYLSDPRRTEAERLRTVLRRPVRSAR
jgi:hypothetical protein